MYFKRFFLAFSLAILAYSAFAQTKTSKKEADFVKACQGVVKAFYEKNVNKINKYINPSFGMYSVEEPGFGNGYDNKKYFTKNDEMLVKVNRQEYKYIEILKPDFSKTPLQFDQLPEYVDGNWDKNGFFADSTYQGNELSYPVEYMMGESGTDNQAEKKLKKIKFIERKARKVIFAPKKGGLVFHMAYINGKWYLILVVHQRF